MMRLLLLLVVLTELGQGSVAQRISTERVDLYQGDRHLVHLDNTTFFGALLDKPHAWAVEFYKDWCGHCQKFAPIWSEVARQTKDWGAVVKVAAINCARRRNNAICRRYGIHGVPAVRLFGPGASRGDPGTSTIHHHPGQMVDAIVEFVTTVHGRRRPAGWPDLSPFTGSLQQLLRGPEPVQALVLESESPTAERPALVVFRAGRQQTVTAGRGEEPRQVFGRALRQLVGAGGQQGAVPTAAPATPPPPQVTPAPTRAPTGSVFMVDMENAIVGALKQEVTSHQNITGERMTALRGFLRMLVNYFPGRQQMLQSLSQLLQFVDNREKVTGGELERFMRSKTPSWAGLPELQPYQACRGSKPSYRGYSCGLWTLFHTVTVQARRTEKRLGRAVTVLPAIHGYVKNFFSCSHCSQHFQRMAAQDGLFDVTNAYDAVFWLWRAHNKVNKRLANDITEDPLHPKIQFPDQNLCPSCIVNGRHDPQAVLQFLDAFYGAEAIRPDGLASWPVPAVGQSIPQQSPAPSACRRAGLYRYYSSRRRVDGSSDPSDPPAPEQQQRQQQAQQWHQAWHHGHQMGSARRGSSRPLVRVNWREAALQRRKVADWQLIVCVVTTGLVIMVSGLTMFLGAWFILGKEDPFILIGPVVCGCGLMVLLMSVETCVRRHKVVQLADELSSG
ncbi:sulfhydryl oxidase 1-like [Pollicipes pollicipes]|uniref:sulfhydryl oxidase 1-like n=1 Tax=Pollicipes pollicipes TaxID=41117 RepID=UPI0018859C32|nr:sulfhydryl oxidase 1-like [Pollicipes pollicipes]